MKLMLFCACLISLLGFTCKDGSVKKELPSYVKKVEMLDDETLRITFKEYSPLSWYGDWSEPKKQIIKLGNSYKFERVFDDKNIDYSIQYKFNKKCNDKVLLSEEIKMDDKLANDIRYFIVIPEPE